jgi:TetR/AcrR family transcriptional repressor of nem operon
MNTREEIIRRGAELIHARGYNATGLQEILNVAVVPKGSFYFYFRSKEEFGVEIINHFASLTGGLFRRFLTDDSTPPLQRFEKLIDFFENFFQKNSYASGCPIGNLSLELSDSNERFRKKLHEVIDQMIGHVQACIEDAKQKGMIGEAYDTRDAALFFFHGFEGAVLHMKTSKSPEPLNAFKRNVFHYFNIKN